MMSESGFVLSGIDGANPLGFLAALGVVLVLDEAKYGQPRLRWRLEDAWRPVLDGVPASDRRELTERLASALRAAPASDTEPAQQGRNQRPEFSLGETLKCKPQDIRKCATSLLDAASRNRVVRGVLDILVAFGSDGCIQEDGFIEPTPFYFTRGSGGQKFLDTAKKLHDKVSPDKLLRTLFQPWTYTDEGLSMRWDPVEDRRHAYMDRDPGKGSNAPRTEWMANLLAYRGLAFFPSAPAGGHLRTAGWRDQHRDEPQFTWPLWDHPLRPDAIRSILQLSELVEERPNRRSLETRGVVAAYRSSRRRVGEKNYKLNFSPAKGVA